MRHSPANASPPVDRGGSRALTPGPAAQWLLTPWTVEDVCDFLRCTDRWLRTIRNAPDSDFPGPLPTAQLTWWPADILAWLGISLAEAIHMAQALDEANATGGAQSAREAGR